MNEELSRSLSLAKENLEVKPASKVVLSNVGSLASPLPARSRFAKFSRIALLT